MTLFQKGKHVFLQASISHFEWLKFDERSMFLKKSILPETAADNSQFSMLRGSCQL